MNRNFNRIRILLDGLTRAGVEVHTRHLASVKFAVRVLGEGGVPCLAERSELQSNARHWEIPEACEQLVEETLSALGLA